MRTPPVAWKRGLRASLLLFPAFALAHEGPAEGPRKAAAGEPPAVQSFVFPAAEAVLDGSTLTFREVAPARGFGDLVASWEADTPEGTAVEVQAQIKAFGQWSAWHSFGVWGASGGVSADASDAIAAMDVDTLKLRASDQKAAAFRLRALLHGKDGRLPRLRSLAAAVSDPAVLPGEEPAFKKGPWVRDLAVPERSQMVEQADFKRDICSPTSLSMVLAFHGVQVPTAEAARRVFDRGAQKYGNWPFNTAFAASLGLRARVARLPSLAALQDEVAKGRPVVASVTYAAGELEGSAVRSTRGHLLVVRGFTDRGDVIVNDPAAPDEKTVRRVYRRDQFRRAWLDNKRGLVYLLGPEGSK